MLYVVKISKIGETNTVILSPNADATRSIPSIEVAPGVVLATSIVKSPFAVMTIKEGIDKIIVGMQLPAIKLGKCIDEEKMRYDVELV